MGVCAWQLFVTVGAASGEGQAACNQRIAYMKQESNGRVCWSNGRVCNLHEAERVRDSPDLELELQYRSVAHPPRREARDRTSCKRKRRSRSHNGAVDATSPEMSAAEYLLDAFGLTPCTPQLVQQCSDLMLNEVLRLERKEQCQNLILAGEFAAAAKSNDFELSSQKQPKMESEECDARGAGVCGCRLAMRRVLNERGRPEGIARSISNGLEPT